MFLHLVLFVSTNAQRIVRYKINFPLEGGTGSLNLKPRNRATGESSEMITYIFIYALSLIKSNNWFILDFLPWIINLVQLKDEEELQKKNTLGYNFYSPTARLDTIKDFIYQLMHKRIALKEY